MMTLSKKWNFTYNSHLKDIKGVSVAFLKSVNIYLNTRYFRLLTFKPNPGGQGVCQVKTLAKLVACYCLNLTTGKPYCMV